MVLFWAYVAGLLTLINPCVLPLLPIIIASAMQQSKFGPVALAAGLIVSFTVVGIVVTAFGHLIGLTPYLLNQIAATLMIVFGLVLLIPQASGFFARLATPLWLSRGVGKATGPFNESHALGTTADGVDSVNCWCCLVTAG